MVADSLERLLHKGTFLQFFFSQGVSCLGDSFRFIAFTILLLKLTGSGMSTSLGLIFSVLPSMILSPFAGVIGDIFPARYMMSLIDLVRGMVIFLFIFCDNSKEVFIIVIILSSLEAIYSPLRKKLLVNLAGRDGILSANSLLTGLSGAIYLVGPFLAGLLVEAYGSNPGFIIGGFSAILSSGLIFSIRTSPEKVKVDHYRKKTNLLNEMQKGFEYIKGNRALMELVIICMVIAFCSVSINMAFYPYAFDVLKLGAKEWSLLISVYYGTNLLAALILFLPFKSVQIRPCTTINIGFLITALIWLFYGLTQDFFIVLILQFFEGTVLAVCGILMTSLMQEYSKNSYMARTAGISDIGASIGKIVGMAGAFSIMQLKSYKSIFAISSFILLLFVFFIWLYNSKNHIA